MRLSDYMRLSLDIANKSTLLFLINLLVEKLGGGVYKEYIFSITENSFSFGFLY